MVYRFAVASYSEVIYTLKFDPTQPPDFALSIDPTQPPDFALSIDLTQHPALSIISTLKVGHQPSWVEKHPTKSELIFTALEQTPGRLLALTHDEKASKIKKIACADSGGDAPCTILALENEVLVGNYMSGTVGVFSIAPTSEPFEIKEAQKPIHFVGSGPNKERQESSHPHQVYLVKHSSSEVEVLVPDLGSDKTWRLIKNSEGIWERWGEISYDKNIGGGPRHVVFYDSVLYTLLELSLEVTAHKLTPPSTSSATENPSRLASTSALESPKCPPMLAAELLLAAPNATFPYPLLYATIRNVPGSSGDIISIFNTISSGLPSITRVNEVSTGLSHLRGAILFGTDDKYLIAGGQNGGGIKVYERVNSGTELIEIAHLPADGEGSGMSPTGFILL